MSVMHSRATPKLPLLRSLNGSLGDCIPGYSAVWSAETTRKNYGFGLSIIQFWTDSYRLSGLETVPADRQPHGFQLRNAWPVRRTSCHPSHSRSAVERDANASNRQNRPCNAEPAPAPTKILSRFPPRPRPKPCTGGQSVSSIAASLGPASS